jgi:hypothetical protein
MRPTPKIPHIPEEERTPLVVALLEIIQVLLEQNQELRDEIARLKGEKPKPRIKPSVLEKDSVNKETRDPGGKRPGSAKREKTKKLEIHNTVVIAAPNALLGSERNGFEDFTVQGLLFQPYCKNPARAPLLSVRIQDFTNDFQQQLRIVRLADEPPGPCLNRFLGLPVYGKSTGYESLHMGVNLQKLLKALLSSHLWHDEVEDHD